MLDLPRTLTVAAAFVLGACAATSAQSVAAPAPDAAATPSAAVDVVRPDWGYVVPAAGASTRVAPNGKATVTFLAQGDAFVGKLRMEAGAAVPEHRDPTDEYIHVLEGAGEITIEGEAYPVRAGDTIHMPARARVSFQNGDLPLVALQVFAPAGPEAKYEAWTPGAT